MGVNLLSLEAVCHAQAQLHDAPSHFQLANLNGEKPSRIAIVPERTWVVDPSAPLNNVIPGQLVKGQYRGGEYRIQVRIGNGRDGEIIEARSRAAPTGELLYVHVPVEAIAYHSTIPTALYMGNQRSFGQPGVNSVEGGNCMNATLFLIGLFLITTPTVDTAGAQSVTLYTAGPDGLAQGIARLLTEKTAIKVDVYQATSGDVLARLEAEKGKPRADVVVLASWGEGLAVRDRGLVAPYTSPEAKKLRSEWVDGGLAAQGGAALALIVNS